MLKKTFTYVDFEGNERKEDHYFNLTQTEVIKMENSEVGGLTKLLNKIIAENNNVKLIEYFDKFIRMSYGEKSADGRRFIKSEELSEAFAQTPAYDILFRELLGSPTAAADFVNAIVPKYDESEVASANDQ